MNLSTSSSPLPAPALKIYLCLHPECAQNDVSFTRKDNLTRHIKFFHSSGNDRHLHCFPSPSSAACDPQSVLEESFHITNASECHVQRSSNGNVKPDLLPYKCGHCSKKFRFPSHRLRHEQKLHLADYPYKCDIFVTETHSAPVSSSPDNITGQTILEPQTCHSVFKTLALLNAHKRKVHQIKVETWSCPEAQCPVGFRYKSQLLRHIDRHHTPRTKMVASLKKAVPNQNYTTLENGNSSFKDTNCNENRTQTSPKSPLLVGASKALSCSSSQSSLSSTWNSVEDDIDSWCQDPSKSSFKCSFPGCNREYTLYKNLKSHYQSIHIFRGKAFSCPICQKSFTAKQTLQRHQKRAKCSPKKCPNQQEPFPNSQKLSFSSPQSLENPQQRQRSERKPHHSLHPRKSIDNRRSKIYRALVGTGNF